MSYMWVGNTQTDVGGNVGVAGSARFYGRHVDVRDSCGSATLNGVNEPGDMNWGTSGGTDCEYEHQITCCMPILLSYC